MGLPCFPSGLFYREPLQANNIRGAMVLPAAAPSPGPALPTLEGTVLEWEIENMSLHLPMFTRVITCPLGIGCSNASEFSLVTGSSLE